MNLKSITNIIRNAFKALIQKNPLRMAAATAFFATFALPAIVLIFIELIGLFYNPNVIKHNIFTQLVSVIGRESTVKVYKILYQFVKLAHNWFATIFGFLFLIFVVTTLFSIVRSSINELWNIAIESNPGIKFRLQLRLKSGVVIFFACVLLVAQLIATALQIFLKDYIHEVWDDSNSLLYKIITQLIFVIITTCWFTVLFKYLANAHPDWNTAFIGGLFTAVFFTIGKIVLSVLLTFNMLSEVFGKTGGFVLILLFVFYSSFIFYYGAAFTQALLIERNKKFKLDKHAYVYSIKKIKT